MRNRLQELRHEASRTWYDATAGELGELAELMRKLIEEHK